MVELKTLNDFTHDPKSWASAMANPKYSIDIDGLKEEAIKWVRQMDGDLDLIAKNKVLDEATRQKITGLSATVEWIKHFFNVTDKELK